MTEIIVLGVVIVVIIHFVNQSKEEKHKIEEERKRLSQIKYKAEQAQKQEEEKRILAQIQQKKEQEKKKLDEVNRLEKIRLQKIEDEKYEIFKIVIVGQQDNKFTCILERQDKTYACFERQNTAFQLNSNIKLQKEISDKFNWISQSTYIKIQQKIKLEIQRKQEEQRLKDIEISEYKQRNFHEMNTIYFDNIIQNQSDFTFNIIKRLSINFINQLTKENSDQLHSELNSGVAIIETEGHLYKYIHSYGNMHQAKLLESFEVIPNLQKLINNRDIQINDYGCGQGIGSIVFIDYLKSIKATNYTISKVKLIEPSEIALKRASLNIKYCLKGINQKENVWSIHKTLDSISNHDIATDSQSIKFHILSNILDVDNFSLESFAQKIDNTQKGINYFICVSPKFWNDGNHQRNLRLDNFMIYFQQRRNVNVLSTRENNIGKWTRYERIFMINFNSHESSQKLNSHNEKIDDLPF